MKREDRYHNPGRSRLLRLDSLNIFSWLLGDHEELVNATGFRLPAHFQFSIFDLSDGTRPSPEGRALRRWLLAVVLPLCATDWRSSRARVHSPLVLGIFGPLHGRRRRAGDRAAGEAMDGNMGRPSQGFLGAAQLERRFLDGVTFAMKRDKIRSLPCC